MTDETQSGAESVERVAIDGAVITPERARQFALVLRSGVPELDAIAYLRPDLEGPALKYELARWLRSKTVQAEILRQQKTPWQNMTLDEAIAHSIDKHYREIAYFLHKNNYNDLEGPQRSKADTCRQTLEAKIAGTAGKGDSMSQFLEQFKVDVKTGKIAVGNKTVQ